MKCPVCGNPLEDLQCRLHGQFTAQGVPVPRIVSPFGDTEGTSMKLRRIVSSACLLLIVMGIYLLMRMALGEQ